MGLPYIDTKKIGRGLCNNRPGNFERFFKKYITAAKLAREYQGIIGHTSKRDSKSMSTASYVTNDPTMFGPNLVSTRGNTVWQKLDKVGMDYVAVPKFFLITQVCNSRGVFDVCERSTIIDYYVTWYKVCDCKTAHTDKNLSKKFKRVMKIYSRSSMIVQ